MTAVPPVGGADESHPPASTSARPQATWRHQLFAVVAACLLLAGLWLVPDLTPPLDESITIETVPARIESLSGASQDPSQPNAEVLLLDGSDAGQVVPAVVAGPSGSSDLPGYEVGDDVIVSNSGTPGSPFYVVTDRMRVPVLGLLLAVFAVTVLLVGGWRGLRSLLALALTLGVVVKIVIPLLLRGWDPVSLAVAAATAVTIATLLLTEGWRRTTAAAVLGTFCALALTAGLALVFNGLAEFTQFQANEEVSFLARTLGAEFDVRGLLLAAVIFGALGVLDDVTVTQAATVAELHAANPGASRRWLIGSAMNVGRSHIAATVNTLVLAYLGASLPLLVLFAVGHQPPLLTASGEFVAVEIVRGLVGSIGIVAAVPLTTVVASLMVGERAEGHEPAGS